MIGDKLLIQEQHKIKATACFRELPAFDKAIIAIGGASGTGKSEHAYLLREAYYAIGKKVIIISLDDYYATRPKERNEIRWNAGIDYVGHTEIIWGLVREPLLDFKNKENANSILKFREYDKYIDAMHESKINKNKVDIILLEGLYSGYISYLCDYFIYLEGTYHETKTFRIERAKEEQNSFRQKVLAKEQTEVEFTKKDADMFVSLDGKICKRAKK